MHDEIRQAAEEIAATILVAQGFTVELAVKRVQQVRKLLLESE